jgi:2'-5' RNA ligase
MRLFFALWPGVRERAAITHAAAALPDGLHGRRIPPQNYHLTLAFVGEVAAAQFAVLQQIGRDQRLSGCTLTLDAFEYWREARVVVACARQTPPELLELWAQLRGALAHSPAAFRLEPARPLRAHVTLARKVAQAPVLPAMSPFEWTAREFSLVRSDTSGVRSVYTVVDTWPLLYRRPGP